MRAPLGLTETPSAAGETPRQILSLFAVIAGTLATGMVGYYCFGLHGSLPFPQDQVGYVLGRDFLNTWFFGKAAFLPDPGQFYDHDLYAGGSTKPCRRTFSIISGHIRRASC